MLIERIAKELLLPPEWIARESRVADTSYKLIEIPKKNGSTRRTYAPARRLKAIQRMVARLFIAPLATHDAAHGFVPHRSALSNAAHHVGQRYVGRADIKDFFPSITRAHVHTFIGDIYNGRDGWDDVDTEHFCNLVCRSGVLCVGAPTSPALSNAICFDLDSVIFTAATKKGIKYTRYADDLCFSSNAPNAVYEFVEKNLQPLLDQTALPSGLKLNKSKTRHASKKRRMRMTGLTITSHAESTVSLGRKNKRRISALVHKSANLSPTDRASLRGWLAHAQGVEPKFVDHLFTKYGAQVVEPLFRA